MATIVTRSGKGSPLTHAEVDSNFTNLNTDKLETAGGSMTGNLSFGDNDKAIFGAGSDLQIYHDGDDSYIKDAGTGDLKIQGANVRLENPSGVRYFQGSSGVAYLYNSGDIKLSTSSTGVDITGTLTSDGLTVDGDAVISSANARLRLKETDTTDNDTQLQTTGGVFKISRLDDDNSTATQRFTIDNSTGDISFYEDTGTTAKLHWSAADESLGIGLSSASHVLDVTGDKDTWITKLYNSGSDANASGLLVRSDATAAHDASVLGVYADGGYKMMVKSSGNVGIGTSSPSAPLQVKGSAGEIRLQRPTASQSDWSFKLPSSGGELTFYDNNNAAERMRITSSGSVGIGLTDPNYDLSVGGSSGSHYIQVRSDDSTSTLGLLFADAAAGNKGAIFYDQSAEDMFFRTNNSERMRIASDGSVGIGTTSPSDNLHIASSLATIRLEDSDVAGGASYSLITSSSNGNIQFSADPDNVRSSTDIRFSVDGSEAARLDASGNLLVGKTSSSSTVQGIALKPNGQGVFTSDGGTGALFNRLTSDGDILEFRKDGTTVGSIGASSGKTVITLDPRSAATTGSGFLGGDGVVFPSDKTGAASDADVSLGGASTRFKDLYLSGTAYVDTAVRFSTNVSTPTGNTIFRPASNTLAFGTNSSEAARIDASGNLLVGGTNTAPAGNNVEGVAIGAGGYIQASYDGFAPMSLNRKTNDGDIAVFSKDGATVGSIGTSGGDLYVGNGTRSLMWTGTSVFPRSGTGGISDATVDLGNGSNRFKDLYLSGGVYLGGTDSDHLLNDYETGSWTPTAVQGITGFTLQRASYTKVGRLVYVQAYLSAPSGKSGSAIRLGGLPFTAGTNVYSGGFLDTATDGDVGFVRTNSSSTQLHVYSWDASTVHRNNMTGNEAGSQLIFSVVYEVA